MGREVPKRAGRGPYLRAAGWPHPAHLGPCSTLGDQNCRRTRRAGGRTYGPCARRTDRRTRCRDGHCGTWRHQYDHGHGQRVARARSGAPYRRLHFAPAGQYGTAAGHPACRHSASCHAPGAHRARRRSSRARVGRGSRPRLWRFGRARASLYRDSNRRAAYTGRSAPCTRRLDACKAATQDSARADRSCTGGR